MPAHPSAGPQRIVPYLSYADAPAAIEFLCRAFGFTERFRYPMPNGSIGHAEIVRDGNVVMLASSGGGFGESPLNLATVHGQLLCYVDKVDEHYAQALAEGATIITEPGEDHGMRSYRAMDPEGHRWIFATLLPGSAKADA
jgi:uncharacterized glyoxalase superfamily protein PhnB